MDSGVLKCAGTNPARRFVFVLFPRCFSVKANTVYVPFYFFMNGRLDSSTRDRDLATLRASGTRHLGSFACDVVNPRVSFADPAK